MFMETNNYPPTVDCQILQIHQWQISTTRRQWQNSNNIIIFISNYIQNKQPNPTMIAPLANLGYIKTKMLTVRNKYGNGNLLGVSHYLFELVTYYQFRTNMVTAIFHEVSHYLFELN